MTKQANVTSVFTRSCIRVVQAEVAVAQLEDGSFDVICNQVFLKFRIDELSNLAILSVK